jgi:hypothetical protein
LMTRLVRLLNFRRFRGFPDMSGLRQSDVTEPPEIVFMHMTPSRSPKIA